MHKMNMIGAMKSNLGIISPSCEVVGINRSTHYRWMKKDKEYRKSILEIIERALDFAEAALMKNIGELKEASIIFFLKTKGKSRGYAQPRYSKDLLTPIDEIDLMSEEELVKFINKTS